MTPDQNPVVTEIHKKVDHVPNSIRLEDVLKNGEVDQLQISSIQLEGNSDSGRLAIISNPLPSRLVQKSPLSRCGNLDEKFGVKVRSSLFEFDDSSYFIGFAKPFLSFFVAFEFVRVRSSSNCTAPHKRVEAINSRQSLQFPPREKTNDPSSATDSHR
jgi:hypothetical protein